MSAKVPVLWFGALLLLSLFSRWWIYQARANRCSLDGNRIIPIYQVDLMVGDQTSERFCCIRCAREWPDVPRGAYWAVRDEVTGGILDAAMAHFVESSIVTVRSRRDHTHVFAQWVDAENHIAGFAGTHIPNPLQTPH